MKQMPWIAAAIVVMISVLAVGSFAAAQEATPEPQTESSTTGTAFLGVRIAEDTAGARVIRVVPVSAAADAGVQEGDVITAVDGAAVTADTLPEVIATYAPGTAVTLDVLRDGATVQLTATLGELPARGEGGFGRGGEGRRGDGRRGGMPGMPNLDAAIMFDGFDSSYTVFALAETSLLYEAGLREGDRILTIDGTAYDPLALREYLAGLAEDATVTVRVLRAGETTDLTVPAAALNDATGMFGMGFGMREGRPPFDEGRPFGGAPFPPDTTPEAPGDYSEGGA
jgi:S1-C subfamily serine protease